MSQSSSPERSGECGSSMSDESPISAGDRLKRQESAAVTRKQRLKEWKVHKETAALKRKESQIKRRRINSVSTLGEKRVSKLGVKGSYMTRAKRKALEESSDVENAEVVSRIKTPMKGKRVFLGEVDLNKLNETPQKSGKNGKCMRVFKDETEAHAQNKAEIQRLKAEIDDLSTQLANAVASHREALSTLQTSLEAETSALTQAKKQLEDKYKEKIVNLKAKQAKLIRKLDDHVKDLEEENSNLRNTQKVQIEAHDAIMSTIEGYQKSLEANKCEYKSLLDKVEKEKASVELMLESEKKENITLSDHIVSLEKQMQTAKEQNGETIKHRLQEQETCIEEMKAQSERLTQELVDAHQHHQKEISQLKSQDPFSIKQVQEKIEELEKTHASEVALRSECEKKLQEMKCQIEVAYSECEQKIQRLQEAQSTKLKATENECSNKIKSMEIEFKEKIDCLEVKCGEKVEAMEVTYEEKVTTVTTQCEEKLTELKGEHTAEIVAIRSEYEQKMEENVLEMKEMMQKNVEEFKKKEKLFQQYQKKIQEDEERMDEFERRIEAIINDRDAQLKQTREHYECQLTDAIDKYEHLRDQELKLKQRLHTAEHALIEVADLRREEELVRRRLHNIVQDMKGKIRVFCRIRPFSGKTTEEQRALHQYNAVKDNALAQSGIPSEGLEVNVPAPTNLYGSQKQMSTTYRFDKVFGPDASQANLFDHLSGLVHSSMDGYDITVFAYGQTGSGKTHTMLGPSEDLPANASEAPQPPVGRRKRKQWQRLSQHTSDRGMIPRTVDLVFKSISDMASKDWTYTLESSFVEIYNEEIRDLLKTSNAKKTETHSLYIDKKSGKVVVKGLTKVPVHDSIEVQNLLFTATANRTVKKTAMNDRSSRSHTIFQLDIHGVNSSTKEVLTSTLRLVDLAGSERLDKSKACGQAAKEARCINSSLSSLLGCISAIEQKQSHVPFRNSKLTYLLKDALSGGGKTVFFINISPDPAHTKESTYTLKFADQLRQIELKPSTANASKKSKK